MPPATHYWTRITASAVSGRPIEATRVGSHAGMLNAIAAYGGRATAASSSSSSIGAPIQASDKYETEEYEELDGKTTLRLNIRNMQPADYGDYRCIAANALGAADQTVTVYGKDV